MLATFMLFFFGILAIIVAVIIITIGHEIFWEGNLIIGILIMLAGLALISGTVAVGGDYYDTKINPTTQEAQCQ